VRIPWKPLFCNESLPQDSTLQQRNLGFTCPHGGSTRSLEKIDSFLNRHSECNGRPVKEVNLQGTRPGKISRRGQGGITLQPYVFS